MPAKKLQPRKISELINELREKVKQWRTDGMDERDWYQVITDLFRRWALDELMITQEKLDYAYADKEIVKRQLRDGYKKPKRLFKSGEARKRYIHGRMAVKHFLIDRFEFTEDELKCLREE